MKAKEFVGKWIVSNVLTDEINAPAGAAFKVIGYVQNTDWLIVDAKRWGWLGLTREDIVFEQGETYKYVNMDDITKVL